MEITVKGVFRLSSEKSYAILDSKKNEIGHLDIDGDILTLCINGEEDKIVKETELEILFDEKGWYLTTDSLRWIEYNPNPSTSKANDCSIRAYCAAENLEWDAAYDIACRYGKNANYMPNDTTSCEQILEGEFGYTKHKLSKEEKSNGITVKDFCVKHPEGTYILDMPRHLVAVINGEYYDSWDCGKKKIKAYWSR